MRISPPIIAEELHFLPNVCKQTNKMAVKIAKKFRFHRHFGILSVKGFLIFHADDGKKRKYDEFVVSS